MDLLTELAILVTARSWGAELIDRCKSDAPLSTIAFKSCCSVTLCGGVAVAMLISGVLSLPP